MVIFFILWNAAVFLIYGIDKLFACKKMRRIPEKTLILISFLMGGVGALLGMNVFKHKTRKMKFNILVPLGFLVSVFVLFLLLYKEKMLSL